MNQLTVFIIFAVIGIINYLVRQSAANTRRPGSGTRPGNPQNTLPPSQTRQPVDDERLRKFMEALGVPDAATAPPARKVVVRPQPPFVPRAQPPVRRQAVNPVPRRVVAQEVFISTPAPQPAYQAETVSMQQAPAAAVAGPASTFAAETSIATDLRSLLKSSSSIRAAMVLKEILGAPKGLQTVDTIPGLR